MLDDETLDKFEKIDMHLDNLERKIKYLREENLKLKMENEQLKKQVESLVKLNEILALKK